MIGRASISITAALLCASALGCGRRPPENLLPEEQARAAALAGRSDARVVSDELEREEGRWIYSYDVEVPGLDGVEEIHVDALTGEVVSREHESAEDEAREAEEEGEPEADAGATTPRGSAPTAGATHLGPDGSETELHGPTAGPVPEQEGPGARNELVAVEGS